MSRRGLTEDQVWVELRERARRIYETHGHTVVPRGMLLANELRGAAETLGVFPPREHDRLTELMFRTETLHAFGDYVTAAYSVREQVETLVGKRQKLLSVEDPEVTRARSPHGGQL